MFCPKCATNNLEGASFCRTCGANISLVPQALTGQLTQPQSAEVEGACGIGRGGRALTLDRAFKNIAMGFAFLIVSIALSRSIGQTWWFWMLIPSFVLTSTGIAQYIRLKERAKTASLAPPPVQRTFAEPPITNGLMPPAASVTEGTTRHLNHQPK